jgi:hypothetical protein
LGNSWIHFQGWWSDFPSPPPAQAVCCCLLDV